MKLIAIRSFKNPERTLQIKDAVHPDHVHKGATFVIGEKLETPFEKLTKQEKLLVQHLTISNCVGDAFDAKVVSEVERELKFDADRAARDAERVAAIKASGKAVVFSGK